MQTKPLKLSPAQFFFEEICVGIQALCNDKQHSRKEA
jgi:hypothetical protein